MESSFFRELIKGLVYWISPPTCVTCAAPLTGDDLFCDGCRERMEEFRLSGPTCRLCGAPILGRACPLCNGEGLPLMAFRASFLYKDLVVKVVEAFKYRGIRSLATYMGSEMLPLLSEFDPDYLVPIPLHAVRRRERGFSQTTLLVKQISRMSGIPAKKALRRTKNTRSQTGLMREERRTNVKGAFSLNTRELLEEGSDVLIVDDVLTTGSTLIEAARVLKEGGAQNVFGIVFAFSFPQR